MAATAAYPAVATALLDALVLVVLGLGDDVDDVGRAEAAVNKLGATCTRLSLEEEQQEGEEEEARGAAALRTESGCALEERARLGASSRGSQGQEERWSSSARGEVGTMCDAEPTTAGGPSMREWQRRRRAETRSGRGGAQWESAWQWLRGWGLTSKLFLALHCALKPSALPSARCSLLHVVLHSQEP